MVNSPSRHVHGNIINCNVSVLLSCGCRLLRCMFVVCWTGRRRTIVISMLCILGSPFVLCVCVSG